MSRPVLFVCLGLVAVAASYLFWNSRNDKAAALPSSVAAVAPPTSSRPQTAPVSLAVAQLPAPRPKATDDRRRILDSNDAMATIIEVRAKGNQDEKNWAYTLLTGCNQTLKHKQRPEESEAASTPEAIALENKKKHATETLKEKCKGVGILSSEEREKIEAELRESRKDNPSILGQLEAAGAGQNTRWNSQQAELISNSLYGDDPIVAKAAFLDLMAAFDRNAPGGGDRLEAFSLALSPVYLNFPLSEWERLQGCRVSGWCDGYYAVPVEPQDNPEIVRLTAAYKAAAAAHVDARGILAIR